MPTKDIESIHAVVSSTLSFHDRYSVTMKTAFRFSCELFVLWQVVMYGVLSAKDIWTLVFGILGIALIVGTAIALHIYNLNAKDLEDHSKIISDIECKPKKEQVENIEKFAEVFIKYKIGRNRILIMNVTTTVYIVLFAFVNMLFHIIQF